MPVEFKTLENLLDGDKPDLRRTVLGFMLATKGEMNRKAMATAVLAWRALKIESTTAITLVIGGYDDDPRELWEIPEVCTYVRKFCTKTNAHEHPQVEPQSRNWLLLCGADPERSVSLWPISRKEALDRSAAFFDQVINRGDDK
jgi:hypothetical protein